MSGTRKSEELSHLLFLSIAVAVIAVLYLAKEVVVPLALAVLFSFLFAPVVTFLQRIHLPRILAILLVILAAVAVVGGGGWTVFRQLVDVTADLPAYASNINEKVESLHPSKSTSFSRAQKEVELLSEKIGVLSSNTTPDHRHSGTKELGASPSRPVSVQEVGHTNGKLGTLHGVLGAMISILLVVVFTFFMLLQREDLRNRFIRLTGRGHLNLMTQALDDASHRVSRYLSLQLLVNTCYGLIIFTALHFIGLPHAILWGALAGVLRFIPYIGAPIAAFLPTIFSVAVFTGWIPTLIIVGVFFCLEIVTANYAEPHLYGKQTGLSPLAILVAAVFWTLIWGPIGLILSVPLTVCLVVMGSHVPSLKFLTVLLGDQPVMTPAAHYYQRLLASDEQEASQVLETYLKENSVPDLYDHVLVPALGLFELDRHRNTLDDATVRFVTETAREFIEELDVRGEANQPVDVASEASGAPVVEKKKVVCVPVRDDADEIIAIMLAQLLTRAGHSVKIIPPGHGDAAIDEVSRARPDVVCLSALPPYAMAYARRLYGALSSSRSYPLEIILGLWNYAGDLDRATKVIGRDEENFACTTLTEVVQRVSFPNAKSSPDARQESGPSAILA